jgi:exonuclease III
LLTVLSWNVNGGGIATASVSRLDALLAQDLRRHEVEGLDIIALQHVLPAAMASITKQLSSDYAVVDSRGLLDSRVGLLVALRKATLTLNGPPTVVGTRAMEISIQGTGVDIRLVNAYLPHATKSARKNQLETKLRAIEDIRGRVRGTPERSMIVCGDLNTALTMCTSAPIHFRSRHGGTLVPDFATLGTRSETAAPFYELTQERNALLGLIDEGFTDPRQFANKEPMRPYSNWGTTKATSSAQRGDVTGMAFLRPLDYILAAKPLGMTEQRYVYAAHAWQSSDHLPVLAVLAPEEQPRGARRA